MVVSVSEDKSRIDLISLPRDTVGQLDELPTLLEIGRRSVSAEVTAIVLQPPRYSLFVGIEPNSNRGWVMMPNVKEMRRYASSALSD